MARTREGKSESGLVVVEEIMPNAKAAHEIARYLKAKPHEHEVAQIAKAVGIPATQVVEVMNSYVVSPDGTVNQVPEGQGGNWLPEEVAEQYRSSGQEAEAEDIGYRWPDGELRDTPFNFKDPEHRKEVGLPDLGTGPQGGPEA